MTPCPPLHHLPDTFQEMFKYQTESEYNNTFLPPLHSNTNKNLLAIVENGPADLDGEAGGPVEAVPGGVCRRAGVRLEGDVGPHGGAGGPGPGGRPGGTSI